MTSYITNTTSLECAPGTTESFPRSSKINKIRESTSANIIRNKVSRAGGITYRTSKVTRLHFVETIHKVVVVIESSRILNQRACYRRNNSPDPGVEED